MLVFIRLLPEAVTQNDLRKFVGKAIRSSWLHWLFPQARIHSTEIRKFANGQNHSVEYHAIVDIEPAKAAVAAIRKLNRTPLKGKQVEVRKYYHRSLLRDRRKALQEDAQEGDERRRRDRRRESLEVERVGVSGTWQGGSLQGSQAVSQ
jgi:hypothetical protein